MHSIEGLFYDSQVKKIFFTMVTADSKGQVAFLTDIYSSSPKMTVGSSGLGTVRGIEYDACDK